MCFDEEAAPELGHTFPEDEESDDDDCREVLFEESLGATCGFTANRLYYMSATLGRREGQPVELTNREM